MHYYFLFLLMCCTILCNRLYAQDGTCGTEISPKAYEHYKTIVNHALNTPPTKMGIKYFPVRHIIVRRSDGTGGISTIQRRRALDSLNADFLEVGIQFYTCSWVFIDSTPFYELNVTGYPSATSEAVQLADLAEQEDVVNVFYLNKIIRIKNNGDTVGLCGRADMPYMYASDRIYLNYRCPRSTFAHEMGHYLGLLHTHQGYSNAPNLRERVIRQGNAANCSHRGDLLCDTPADPLLESDSINSCVYQGVRRDDMGALYTPMTNNFMAYGQKSCRNTFTEEQKAMMRYATFDNTLRNNLSCPCNSLTFLAVVDFDPAGMPYQTNGDVAAISNSNCDADAHQIRVGNCRKPGAYVSLDVDVPRGINNITLNIKGRMLGLGGMKIYIDNVLQRSTLLHCRTSIQLNNISNYTQDGKIVLKFEDPSVDCQGDFMLDYLTVTARNCFRSAYAELPYTTNFGSGTLDDYWYTFSASGSGRIQVSSNHNPPTGGKLLLMDQKFSTSSSHTINYAELRVDLTSCSGPKTLFVKWNRLLNGAIPNYQIDGIYFSDNGGLTFVKGVSAPPSNTWTDQSINLNSLIQGLGLTLSNKFVIRFQVSSGDGAPNDALAIDAVSVIGCLNATFSASGSIPLPTPNPKRNHLPSFDQVQLQLFPNPAHQWINIRLSDLPVATTATLIIQDVLGRVHSQSKQSFEAGRTQLQLSLQDLPPGVYTLVIQHNDGLHLSQRFVVHP